MIKSQNLLNLIFKWSCFLLGISICGYFFYIRILLKRIPHKIEFVWNPYLFAVYVIMILFFCYLLKQQLYLKKSQNKTIIWFKEKLRWIKEKPGTWLKEKCIQRIAFVYDKSLHEVYLFFVDSNRLPIQKSLYKIVEKINALSNYKDFQDIRGFFAVYFIFMLLPRIIVGIAVNIDVIIFNEFYYLYKIIWVLIFPLLWKIKYYLLNEYITLQLEFISIFLEMSVITDKKLLSEKYNRDGEKAFEFKSKNLHPQIRKLYPYSEKTEKLRRLMAHLFLHVKGCYLEMYNANSILFQLTRYQKTRIFMLLLSILFWGSMAFKLFYA